MIAASEFKRLAKTFVSIPSELVLYTTTYLIQGLPKSSFRENQRSPR